MVKAVPMAKLQQSDQQQLWAEAQRRCRLSDAAVQTAKELGIGPRSLIKTIPAPTQPWKAPVEDRESGLAPSRLGRRADQSGAAHEAENRSVLVSQQPMALDHVRRQGLEPPAATMTLHAVAIGGDHAERATDRTVTVAKVRQACLRVLLLL